jgi:4-amino-4-deoxy-L-arabinose transferase-like glycosyltransferase
MTEARAISIRSTLSLPFWGTMAGLGALVWLLCGAALVHPLSHDEQQYVAAAAFAWDLQIYRDFVYLQMPYFPLLLGAVMEVFTDRPFLVARLFNWAMSVGSVLLVYFLARVVHAPRYLALGAATLFATSSVANFSLSTARNDLLPCFFALAACYCFLRASLSSRRSSLLYLASGVLLAGAVGAKITFAFAPAAIVLVSVARASQERRSDYWRRELLPLVAGGVLGAVPLIALAAASFENFWYDVVVYHTTATPEWYIAHGEADALGLFERLRFFVRFYLRQDATLAASIWLIATLGVWLTARGRAPLTFSRGVYALPLVLLVASAIFAFVPAPSWLQYFTPVVPFAVLAPIFIWRLLPAEDARRSLPIAIAAICVGSVYGLGNLGLDALAALRAENWTPTAVQRLAREVDAALGSRSGAIATLAPIYVLESDHPVPLEFASGVFVFRTGDLLDAPTLRRLRALSPATLEASFDHAPPVGILVGGEPDLDVEAPLRDYARARGYHAIGLSGPPASTLFIAPGAERD